MKEKQKRKNLYTKFEKEQKKKQKRSPSIQTIYLSNESPEPCTSYRIASNRSKRKTQESAKKSIHKIIRETCFNCKSKYPPKKKKMKNINWVQCRM